jgi:hypothetical protein
MNMSFIAQRYCRQRAAIAALARPIGRRGTPRVRQVRSRSQDLRRSVKTEGKIKGPARGWPLSQSAHGLGAARRLAACVPRRSANPQGIELGRVPFSMRYACLSWSLCHGIA